MTQQESVQVENTFTDFQVESNGKEKRKIQSNHSTGTFDIGTLLVMCVFWTLSYIRM